MPDGMASYCLFLSALLQARKVDGETTVMESGMWGKETGKLSWKIFRESSSLFKLLEYLFSKLSGSRNTYRYKVKSIS